MDIKTLILVLAVGNALFSAALFIFQLTEAREERNRDWTRGKLFQAVGWFLLYWRGSLPDAVTFTVGNIVLIIGIAYETWAILRIAGTVVRRRVRVASLIAVTSTCLIVTPFLPALRIGATSLAAASFFAVTGLGLFRSTVGKSPLRTTLAWSFCLVALVVATRGVLALVNRDFNLFTDNLIQEATFLGVLVSLLINGFGILLLVKEDADRAIRELSREQHAILEALPTGLCILKDRIIFRCNPAFEAMFGFAHGTLTGRPARCLFENDETFQSYGRRMYESIQATGRFSDEVEYVRQTGERFWAIDHAVKVSGSADAFVVFSVTDISEQKRQQETLTRQKEALQETLARTKKLEGMISICMHCKSIHNKKESWEQVEKYLMENSDAQFSHGICPECYKKHYSG
jgi:PAS domain S-box